MKWICVLGLLFTLKGFAVTSYEAEVAPMLPPVIVQGKRPAEVPNVDANKGPDPVVSVTAGVGAKVISAPTNEMGVPLLGMENEEDLSQSRRAEAWLLTSQEWRKFWRQQIHFAMATNPSLRGGLVAKSSRQQGTFEFGVFQDHRLIKFRESSGNPLDPDQGTINHYRQRLDQGYLKFNQRWESFDSLLDADSQSKDVYAGSERKGVSKSHQHSINLKWNPSYYQALTYAQWRHNDFDSATDELASSQSKGLRIGGKMSRKGELNGDLLEVGVSHEILRRLYADDSAAEIQRLMLTLLGTQRWIFPSFESRLHLKTDFARDQMIGESGSPLSSGSITESPAWDLGLELATPMDSRWGLVSRVRRFALLPTPTQRFGDGVLLQGSPLLEQEWGFRASAGPWWAHPWGRVELTPFYEHTMNEPLMVAISPVAAKTLAIGSVVARGVELKIDSDVRPFKIQFVYSLQEALNNSSVQWQRGLPVPGRPVHSVRSDLQYHQRSWRAGLRYAYQSSDAMDLSGLWFKSPHHDLNGFVGYGTKAWEVRLTGDKLMASANELPTTMSAGQAGVDLLEPKIEQTEIKLLCEFIL